MVAAHAAAISQHAHSSDNHSSGPHRKKSRPVGAAHIFAHKLVHRAAFQNTVGLIIMLNFVIIIMETDVNAQILEDDSVDFPGWIGAASWAVLVIFVCELVLRIYVERCEFWTDRFNVFDFVIVVVDGGFSIIGLIFGPLFPVSGLRIVRLCKLARVSKIFRVFPELRLMMAGLLGSVRAIFWGTVLLTFFLLVWAVVAVQFIHPLNMHITESGFYAQEDCERCPRAYSSVAQSVLTLSQQIVAGDSWGTVTLPVIEHSPWTALFFAAVTLTVGMAVLNLILGVVVNVATQAREDLKEQMDDERTVKQAELHGNLSKMVKEMDVDFSGDLSKENILGGYQSNQMFRQILQDMNIQEEDLEILWSILDSDRTGSVPYDKFISHCYNMRESDMQFVLAHIKYTVNLIKVQLCDKLVEVENDIKHQMDVEEKMMENMMETEMGKMQKAEEAIMKDLDRVDNVTADIDRKFDMMSSNFDVQDRRPSLGSGGAAAAGMSAPDQQMIAALIEDSRRWQAELTATMRALTDRFDVYWRDSSRPVLAERKPASSMWSLTPCCMQEDLSYSEVAVTMQGRRDLDGSDGYPTPLKAMSILPTGDTSAQFYNEGSTFTAESI